MPKRQRLSARPIGSRDSSVREDCRRRGSVHGIDDIPPLASTLHGLRRCRMSAPGCSGPASRCQCRAIAALRAVTVPGWQSGHASARWLDRPRHARNGNAYTSPIVQRLQDENGQRVDPIAFGNIIDLQNSELSVEQALPTPGKKELSLTAALADREEHGKTYA